LGQDQHDPPARPLPPRCSSGRQSAARPLAHRDVLGGAALRPRHRALRHRRPINGASFRAYIEQFLLPTLSPGDIVIMDNLGSHKAQAIRRLIRAAGAKLFFLPRYSPDLNPIEQVFAKLKTLLRKTDPRTIEDTWKGIGALLDHFTPKECANYLANAGYAST
jgi:transposase